MEQKTVDDGILFLKQQYMQAGSNGKGNGTPISIIVTGWLDLPYIVERLNSDTIERYKEIHNGRLTRDSARSKGAVEFLTRLRAIGDVFPKIHLFCNANARVFTFKSVAIHTENDAAIRKYQNDLDTIFTSSFLEYVNAKKRVAGFIQYNDNQLTFKEMSFTGTMPAIIFSEPVPYRTERLQAIEANETDLLKYLHQRPSGISEWVLEKEGHLWKWSPAEQTNTIFNRYAMLQSAVVVLLLVGGVSGLYKKYTHKVVPHT